MPHGLYRKLDRRYGEKLSGAARAARALEKQQEFARWLRTITVKADCASLLPRGVAIVGAGFAGLSAAWTLAQSGVRATVFEARSKLGGRVETDRKFIPGRLIEAGAELIGLNHGAWLDFARQFGLGLTVLTSEDQYAGARLEIPIRMKGRPVADRAKLHKQMTFVLQNISNDAKVITDPAAPWTAPRAAALDATSVADRVSAFVRLVPPAMRHPLLVEALELQLGNDNVLPTSEQSYLGLLALVAGGRFGNADVDLKGYWTATEEFRCSEGNDRLGTMLHEHGRFTVHLGTPVRSIEINPSRGFVTLTWSDRALRQTSGAFHYVILTAPPSAWKNIRFTPALPAGMEMATGPAVKYLSRVPGRFWLRHKLAPSGLADDLGQTWEPTENQTLEAQGIGLSAFAGSTGVPKGDGLKHFRTRLPTLYPGFSQSKDRYVDWPKEPFIETGYACPRVGQVTTVGRFLSSPYQSRLIFAGEHTCMPFFGYMEGALQSGARAAKTIVDQCAGLMVAGASAPRDKLRHEYQRAEAVADPLPIAVGAGWPSTERAIPAMARSLGAPVAPAMTRPWVWSAEAHAEQCQPAPVHGVVLLEHQHIRRTCPGGQKWTAAPNASPMTPGTMNPGFIRPDDTLLFDTTLNDRLTRLVLDTPKFATMVSAASRKTRTAHNEDQLRVALVDLTGDKICKPGLAVWGPTFLVPGASSAKVLILFAAHQLIFDLNQLSRARKTTRSADLRTEAVTFWKRFNCPPDLAWLVAFDDSGGNVIASPSTNLSRHLNEMVTQSFSGVSTTRAAELILRLGFEYLASVAFQSGLRHHARGGVFYGRAYKDVQVKMKLSNVCHDRKNPIGWKTNPLVNTGIVLTALSAATFMTLLAQRRLVDDAASTAMETLLKGGCGFVSIPGVTRRATKCGLTSAVLHDAVLMEGNGRRYALACLTTNPRWKHRGLFVAGLDGLIKDTNP